MNTKIKVIITGSTGMVGEGVLHECLLHPDIEKILILNRRPANMSHPKLVEVIHSDFFNLSPVENQLSGYDACFYCLGSTSLRMKESEYYSVTYTLTMHVAKVLSSLNPRMTFCYVSGAGTEAPEKAKFKWARIKGMLEQDLMKLPFRKVYLFRPGLLQRTKGLKNTHKIYYIFSLFYPVFRLILPKYVSTLSELGKAMINTVIKGFDNNILEVPDIVQLSEC